MTDFTDFNLVFDNLEQFFFGSYAALATFLVFAILFVFLARGLDVRVSSALTLPLLALFVAIGWFGDVANSQWVINLGLIIVAFFYGFAILKVTT